jgi:hypothetical protein
VRTGESKQRQVVIKVCGLPSSGSVTWSAIVIEVTLYVIGIFDRSEFVLMATITGNRCAGITGSVACGAGCRNMRTCEGESRLVVVEARRLPKRCRMALGTIVTKTARDVIGVFHRSEFVLMTTIADTRGAGVAGFVAEVARR